MIGFRMDSLALSLSKLMQGIILVEWLSEYKGFRCDCDGVTVSTLHSDISRIYPNKLPD